MLHNQIVIHKSISKCIEEFKIRLITSKNDEYTKQICKPF